MVETMKTIATEAAKATTKGWISINLESLKTAAKQGAKVVAEGMKNQHFRITKNWRERGNISGY